MALDPLTQSRRRTRNYDLLTSNFSDISADLVADLASKAPLAHTHLAADITDATGSGRALLVATSAAVQRSALGLASVAESGSFADLSDLPTTFAGYGIAASKAALDAVVADGNVVFQGDGIGWALITSTPTTLAGYGITDAAPNASPTFTGQPKFPGLTVASLPAAAGAQFARVFVTDSTVPHAGNAGVAAIGGGANVVPVYSDGAAWRIG